MVRDAEARGSGPLRRGNPMPPETPEIVAHVPLTPEDIEQTRTTARPASPVIESSTDDAVPEMTVPMRPRPVGIPPAATPPAPGTRAAAAAASAATSSSSAVPPLPTTSPAAPAAPPTPSLPAAPAWPEAPSAPAPQGAAAPSTPTPASPQPPITGVPSVQAAPSSAQARAAQPGVAAQTPPSTPAPQPAQPMQPAQPAQPTHAAQPAPAATTPPTRTIAIPTAPAAATPPAPNAAAAESAASASSRRQQREQGIERRSFLQEERREEPARRGGRGFLNRVGFSLGPNARERAVRDDEHAVSRHWPGPRTVAVVNGKGGAGKTPATVLLSAVFAQYGGAGVLAWDNNQTRGTLGWRTETGAHDRTLLELLPQTKHLLGAQGQSADLAHFVHHQPQEKYDVLRSKPIRLAHENRLNPDDVDSIHAVAAKFYRLIIIDSGNDESDPMWLRMIDLADQIVVATTTRDDHAEAGALLLEALEDRDERSARLARESVVVVSQADPKASSAEVAEVIAGYRPLAREVVGIPFDREMVDGHLRLRALGAPTQQAWLSAAAAVARGF
ncbi:AAA family ATPase [Microbacterium sp. 22215]|uniref:MinD/ParA family ATP-binding protein n=1 Tax=Microbacterium sp. 22215 TaxID=3453893 RepID=UPI003F83E12E